MVYGMTWQCMAWHMVRSSGHRMVYGLAVVHGMVYGIAL